MPHLTPTTRSLILWIATSTSIILCLFRLWLRKWRGQQFIQGDYWIALAIPFMALNAGSDFYVNVHYTPLESLGKDQGQGTAQDALAMLTPQQRTRLDIATRLDMTHRVALCVLLWCLKLAVLDLLRNLLQRLWYYRQLFNILYCILGTTFIAAFVTVFLECKPLGQYWQNNLDFGACKKPDIWLTIYECGNILTDSILLIIPFPIIFKANIPTTKRVRLSLVFGLGLFLVGVNIIRLYRGLHPWGTYSYGRLLWSSVEMTVATVVATSPTIYILARPSFHGKRDEEKAASGRKKRQDSSAPSWSKSEVVFRGGDAARRRWSGLPRTPSMAHCRPGRRPPPAPSVMCHDSWGYGPWSGGHQYFDTRITSGMQSRRSVDDDEDNRAGGGIMVETVVQLDVEDISEMPELASIMTPPPMVKLDTTTLV